MTVQNIQEKIIASFIEEISKTSKFTEEELSGARDIISTSQKADKMADSLFILIGGELDENS